MENLLRWELRRILQQKLLYFFLGLFIFAVIAYSGLITSLELRELVDADERILGGQYFPEFMLRFYSTNVGALFMALITTLYICEDRQVGILVQPLLHGKTKKDIIKTKIAMLLIVSLIVIGAIVLIVYSVAVFRWGGKIFSTPIFQQTLMKYGLIALAFVPIELFLILLAFRLKNTVMVIGSTFFLLMLFTFLNQAAPQLAQFFPLYFPYDWVIVQEFRGLTLWQVSPGLFVFLIFSIGFYWLIMHRADKINFDR